MKTYKFTLLALVAMAASLTLRGNVTYACDASIDLDGPSNLCATLNGTVGTTFAGGVAGIYNNTFTNANASIYIQFVSNTGLGESSQFNNLVTYTAYQTALQAESTDAAKSFVPGSEPGLYSNGDVSITSALASALGITTVDGGDPVLGIEADGATSCTTPGTGGCYNAVITLNSPSGLNSAFSQGYYFRTGSQGADDYDFFSIVEHETDEVLGSASCISTTAPPSASITNGCGGSSPSAVDLFRYTAAAARTLMTVNGPAQYFSPDGGVTDFDGNVYNNTENGDDWADFSSGCTFIQDGTGCPGGGAGLDITNDFGGGNGPEVAILNAVGFNLVTTQTTPEPATFAMFGVSLAMLAGFARSRRKN